MKKILSIILVLICLVNLSSCFLIPAYDNNELVKILNANGYEYSTNWESDHNGVIGYIHGSKEETDDEIYYIYCEGFSSANTIYNYLKSKQNADVSELKMEIESIELVLDSDDVSPADKGRYYEEYVILKDQLEDVQRFGCGRGLNIVWYGTKQAILDIRLGE